jgi:curved DNA-binding protein CbpA
MKTLYELLGVDPDADDEALKTAYRKLAKMHHPDLNPDDPDAERRFRQIVSAIAILGDAKRRAAYDRRLLHELLRRPGGERERPRRISAINAVAAVVMGIVLVKGSAQVEPVSPTSIVTSGTTYDVLQRLDRISAAKQETAKQETAKQETAKQETIKQESVSREWSNDTIQVLASLASPPQASMNNIDEVSVRPEKPTEVTEVRKTDGRELSASERAALVRQAQELQASGDAQGAHVLFQRACRGSRPRCGSGAREQL